MRETLEWLSSHFLAMRLASSDSTSFGLYPQWRDYVSYLAQFLGMLLGQNVDIMMANASSGSCDAEAAIYELWQRMVDVFTPWILPIESDDLVMSPWIQSDSEVAGRMVEAWVGAIHKLQLQFEGKIYTLIWNINILHVQALLINIGWHGNITIIRDLYTPRPLYTDTLT